MSTQSAEIRDSGFSDEANSVRFTATIASTLTLFAGDTGIKLVYLGAELDGKRHDCIEPRRQRGAEPLFVFGNAGDNTVAGTAYADQLYGAHGNDTLVGNAGDDQLQGDDGADILQGGAGNDRLDGGAGADTMAGGLGDDSYFVDDSGDVVTENAGEGTDRVNASINYALGANIENLALTGSKQRSTAPAMPPTT